MTTGTMKRSVDFKFGQSLSKGTKVFIAQTNENTYMVRTSNESTIEYIVNKDAVKLNK